MRGINVKLLFIQTSGSGGDVVLKNNLELWPALALGGVEPFVHYGQHSCVISLKFDQCFKRRGRLIKSLRTHDGISLKVSMIRTYQNHTLQTNPRHIGEEPQNTTM